MSSDDRSAKADLARGMRAVEKLLADDELDRLDKMSDEDVARELRAAGIDPDRIPTAADLLAKAAGKAGASPPADGASPPRADVTLRSSSRPRAAPRFTWLIAAALAALVVVLVIERREVVAWFRDATPIGPDDSPRRDVPPVERAAKLRDEAFTALALDAPAECEQKLDEARALDPAGETSPRVQLARRALAARAATGDASLEEKPRRTP